MKRETPEGLIKWLKEEIEKLLPAGLGSLSLRRSLCINPRCQVCETGEKHASYVLYVRTGKGR